LSKRGRAQTMTALRHKPASADSKRTVAKRAGAAAKPRAVNQQTANEMGVAALNVLSHTARQRADRIRTGLRSWMEIIKEIKVAYAERDWEALGYNGWDAYVVGEFGNELPRFNSKGDERKVIWDLSDAHMSTRAIAAATGTSKSGVARIVKDSPAPTGAPVTGTDGKEYQRAAAAKPSKTVPPTADDDAHHVSADAKGATKVAGKPKKAKPLVPLATHENGDEWRIYRQAVEDRWHEGMSAFDVAKDIEGFQRMDRRWREESDKEDREEADEVTPTFTSALSDLLDMIREEQFGEDELLDFAEDARTLVRAAELGLKGFES
jgi:hypothetical protein